MSRGFTGSDTPDAPPVVAPRAPLPAGVPNYVTPRGLALLRAERDALDAERARHEADRTADADDRARALSTLHQRLAALAPRLTAARLVPIPDPVPDVVRFGASVTLQSADAAEQAVRIVRIVGVDEADAASGRIAFTSPLARALTGHRAGETVAGPTGPLVLVALAYTPDVMPDATPDADAGNASSPDTEGVAASPEGGTGASPRRSASGRPSTRKR